MCEYVNDDEWMCGVKVVLLCVWLQKLLIAQVKMVLKVLFLYIPLPMFWALFDQQVTTLTGCNCAYQ